MYRGYPIQLNVSGVSCVVVGGGKVASRKINTLLLSGAKVQVISPVISSQIANLQREGRVIVNLRDYKGGDDLVGARLVFAATNSEAVNETVCRDAEMLGLFCNDAGFTEHGSFLIPASVHRGGLIITVSTSGASPGLSVKLRDELEEQYGSEYEAYVDFLAELRTRVIDAIEQSQIRTIIFHNVLKFDILDLIRSDRLDEYKSRVFAELARTHSAEEWERILSPHS